MSLLCSLSRRFSSWGALFRLPTLQLTSLSEQNYPRYGAEDTAYGGRYDGDPGVTPVAAAFARDGQHGVSDPWAEVTRRIDRVPCRSAEGESDAEDEQADKQRIQTAPYYRRGIARERPRVRNEARDAEDQHEGTDDLGDDVRRSIVDGRRGAEHAELESLVFGLSPVRQVGQPHEDGADEGTQKLGDDVAGHHCPVELARYGKADGHGGVDIGARELAHAVDG